MHYIVRLTDGSKQELKETEGDGSGTWHNTQPVAEGGGSQYLWEEDAYWCGRSWQKQLRLPSTIWEIVFIDPDLQDQQDGEGDLDCQGIE